MIAAYITALTTWVVLVVLVIVRWKTLKGLDRLIAIFGAVVSTVLLVGTVVAHLINLYKGGLL